MQTFFLRSNKKKVLVVIAENPNVAGFWSTCNFNCLGSHEPACCDTMQMLNCIKIRKATAAKCQKVQNCLYFFKWCRRDSAAAVLQPIFNELSAPCSWSKLLSKIDLDRFLPSEKNWSSREVKKKLRQKIRSLLLVVLPEKKEAFCKRTKKTSRIEARQANNSFPSSVVLFSSFYNFVAFCLG